MSITILQSFLINGMPEQHATSDEMDTILPAICSLIDVSVLIT